MRLFTVIFALTVAACTSDGTPATRSDSGGSTGSGAGGDGGAAGGPATPHDALIALCQGLCQHYQDVGVSCVPDAQPCIDACPDQAAPSDGCVPAAENVSRCALMQPASAFHCSNTDSGLPVVLDSGSCLDETNALRSCSP